MCHIVFLPGLDLPICEATVIPKDMPGIIFDIEINIITYIILFEVNGFIVQMITWTTCGHPTVAGLQYVMVYYKLMLTPRATLVPEYRKRLKVETNPSGCSMYITGIVTNFEADSYLCCSKEIAVYFIRLTR